MGGNKHFAKINKRETCAQLFSTQDKQWLDIHKGCTHIFHQGKAKGLEKELRIKD